MPRRNRRTSTMVLLLPTIYTSSRRCELDQVPMNALALAMVFKMAAQNTAASVGEFVVADHLLLGLVFVYRFADDDHKTEQEQGDDGYGD